MHSYCQAYPFYTLVCDCALKFEAPSTPTVLRQTSAAYMASYIARANFVSLETAKLSLSIMVQWIHQ